MCDCYQAGSLHEVYPDPDCPRHGAAMTRIEELESRVEALENRMNFLVEELIGHVRAAREKVAPGV